MRSVRFETVAVWVMAALLMACGGAAERKSGFLAKGRAYLAAHDYTKARLEFRNALQLDPNDAEASYLAGEADEGLANYREAVQMFEEAIQSNPKHLGARAQLGLLYAYGGAPDKAMTTVAPGLALAPGDPDLLTARAAARQRLGDKVGARADAEKALRDAPDNEHTVAVLASIYQQAGETQQAIDLVSKAVQAPAASPQLRMVLVQLYLAANRHPEAAQALQRLIVAEPDALAYRYRLAEVLLLDKNVDAAESALRAAVARSPQSAEAKLVLANMLADNRSYEVAEVELRRMSAASPADDPLRLTLGQFYLSHQKFTEAEAVYRQIIKDDGTGPNGLTARDRLAMVYVNRNQLADAAPLLDEVLKRNPRDNDALLERASLSLSRDKADAAIVDLRAVQRDQPDSIPVQRALARAYLQNDDATLAEETLRTAVQSSPHNVDLQLDLARLLGSTGRIDQALQILEKLAVDQPANLAVLSALFDRQLAHKDIAGARHTAQLAQAAKPGLPLGNYMSGLAELADGKADAAHAAFERAVAIAPDAIEPISALLRLDLAKQHPDQAIARLDQLTARLPRSPVVHNLRGEVLAELKRTDPAIASFREAIALNPSWITPYQNLAAAEVAAGRNEDAIKALQDGIKASPDAPALMTALAGLYTRLGRIDEAVTEYEVLLRRDPDSTVAANNLAMLLVTHRSDPASLDRARALTERLAHSRNAAFLDTRGWVLYKLGDYRAALGTLQRAVDKAPQAPQLRYHLAMAQLESGARDSARSSLEEALQSKVAFADSDEARRTLSTLQR